MGDTIQVDKTIGDVLSVDLLSIKLRTADNVYVRIPNEQLIKSVVLNLTRFPIRRVPINVSISYKEDIRKVRGILLAIAEKNVFVLDEPRHMASQALGNGHAGGYRLCRQLRTIQGYHHPAEWLVFA